MRKSKSMRMASGLLVVTMLSTCMISGTFARYTTTANASDTARVAKWGVTATVSGSLFGSYYTAHTGTTDDDKMSIVSTDSVAAFNGTDDIVAPGTKSNQGLVLHMAGQPEVATTVNIDVDTTEDSDYSDIWLAKGKYGVMVNVKAETNKKNVVGKYTKSATGETYTEVTDASTYSDSENYYDLIDVVDLSSGSPSSPVNGVERFRDNKYYPVVWSVTNGAGTSYYNGVSKLAEGLTADRAAALNATYMANENLGAVTNSTITVGWEWGIGSEVTGTKLQSYAVAADNGADTILGNLMDYTDDNELTDGGFQVVQITDSAVTGATAVENGTGSIQVVKVGTSEIAHLTVGFNARLTVTQVD